MSLRIAHVEIRNYRSIKELSLDLNDFNAFVGYNNAGKSNCLKAIKWALTPSSKVTEEDFNNKNLGLEVTVTLSGYTKDVFQRIKTDTRHVELLRENCVNNEITFRKETKLEGEKSSTPIYTIKDNNGDFISNPLGAVFALQPFLPKIVHIEAMDDAVGDLTKIKSGSSIKELIQLLSVRWTNEFRLQFQAITESLNRTLSYDGDARLSSLKEVEKDFDSGLNNLFPDLHLSIDWQPFSEEDVFNRFELKLRDFSGNVRELESFGQGTQRCMQMQLINYLARQKNKDTAINFILMIDEPELYLHPLLIDEVRDSLSELAKSQCQVLVTTHSAQLLNLKETFEGALLIRKDETRGTYCLKSRVKEEENKQSELLFNELQNKGYALFAEKVILVEGDSESIVLPLMVKRFVDNRSRQIAFIKVNGCSNLKAIKKICDVLGLKSVITADLDYLREISRADDNLRKYVLEEILKFRQDHDDIALDSEADGKALTYGWFKKKGKTTAAKAWQKFGTEKLKDKKFVNMLTKLKDSGIWLWDVGDIESALGITIEKDSEKTEKALEIIKNLQVHKTEPIRQWLDYIVDGLQDRKNS